MSCLRPCAVGGHGRKGSYQLRLARPTVGTVPAFRAFFVFRPERGAENQPTNPDTMLRPYIPLQTKFCIIDGKSVRVYTPPFSATGTPAVDNNPASKAPESGNGGLFSEVGAEHLNSSRRSCVTCFSRRFRTRFFTLPSVGGPFFLCEILRNPTNSQVRPRMLRPVLRCRTERPYSGGTKAWTVIPKAVRKSVLWGRSVPLFSYAPAGIRCMWQSEDAEMNRRKTQKSLIPTSRNTGTSTVRNRKPHINFAPRRGSAHPINHF